MPLEPPPKLTGSAGQGIAPVASCLAGMMRWQGTVLAFKDNTNVYGDVASPGAWKWQKTAVCGLLGKTWSRWLYVLGVQVHEPRVWQSRTQ